MLVKRVVPDPTWKVEPAPTCISFSLINAIFPDAVSDSTVTDTPVPTVNVLGVLNILLKILVVSLESAVANPLTPVISLPSPTNFVAVIIPVELIFAKVDAVLVIMLSVDATPVNPAPSPTNDDAVTTPLTVICSETTMSVFAIPVNPAPSPKNEVALTTPTTFSFSLGDSELIPTLKVSSTVNDCALINFDKLLARVIAQLLSSYLGHKKRPPSLLTGGREVWVVNQKI